MNSVGATGCSAQNVLVNDVRASKTLSQALRHDPGSVRITLDASGWVPVAVLLAALENAGRAIPRDQLERVVATSDKQRFVLDPETDRIRANQGHSVTVDLGLEPAKPPARLFHGTPTRNLDPILRDGLTAQRRHAVHLSVDRATAHKVGARRGDHLVVAIDAARMDQDGHHFTVSANGVWLTAAVPAAYIAVDLE